MCGFYFLFIFLFIFYFLFIIYCLFYSGNSSSQSNKIITHRTLGTPCFDYQTPYFLEMAFVNLFPYGRGGPGGSDIIKLDAPYLTSLLNMGRNREFQQSPSFIFYAYSWKQRQKVGTISWLATRNDGEEVDPSAQINAGDCLKYIEHCNTSRNNNKSNRSRTRGALTTDYLASLISEVQLWKFVSRLQPYAVELPGTEIYMVGERKKLISMVCSPATNVKGTVFWLCQLLHFSLPVKFVFSGIWQYFFTECQPDAHLAEIYDNAITSVNPIISSLLLPWYASAEENQQNSDLLNKVQRAKILRDHPHLSVRIHVAQQTAFWKCIVNGKHQPFGKVLDFWRRVEFQERGTPHSHNLLCIEKTADISEDSLQDPRNLLEITPVLKLLDSVSTACLQKRHENDRSEIADDMTESAFKYFRDVFETSYNYKVDRATYFQDVTHPCRQRFTTQGRDFRYDKVSRVISDPAVQSLYRRLQLANQFHVCRESCYKNCKFGEPRQCRYHFPMLEATDGCECG